MKDLFTRHVRKYDAWYDKNKFAYLSELAAIRKVLPNKGKGLEIGVGTGRFAGPLGIQCGVDPSIRMLKTAASRGIETHAGKGESLPFADSTFDYAAIIITLCFVENPLKVLQEAKRVLKKKGKLIIAIVDRESFLGEFYRQKKSVFYKQARFFSVNEIARLLNEAGFADASYYQTLFKLPEQIRTIERPKTGFGQGGFVVISVKRGMGC